jgi:hypothetical protein
MGEATPPVSRAAGIGVLLFAVGLTAGACTPTVRVDIQPITINAKLDADVRLRLDQEVKDLVQKNPNLF